ncbi:MAG: carboxypeptidase regulatory-like domain-containing protein [Blastocatellia bacterium]|nr:carboxypeptidase regulatory-like domain-containing protein [Blastocatellia bacterium]
MKSYQRLDPLGGKSQIPNPKSETFRISNFVPGISRYAGLVFRTFPAGVIIGLLLVFSAACGNPDEIAEEPGETETTEVASAKPPYSPTGAEATITGKVNFEGTPPKMARLMMDSDAACAAMHKGPVFSEQVVVNPNGTLKNVFIFVRSGLNYSFPVPSEPAVLDQEGCIYKPHVLGMMANQTLRVTTQDQTTHNVHPIPKINREWNESQPPGVVLTKTFTRPEQMIPVVCNQHSWMKAYIGVLDHPFYAVTDQNGSFTISGLPPGEYEIEAWHEKYQSQTQKVTVGAKESKTLDFTYRADQAYGPSSLKMMPAMVAPCCNGDKHE